jgi:thiol:disulfide interchange protein DsbD
VFWHLIHVRRFGIIVSTCLCIAISSRAQTALPSFDVPPAANHTQVKLILSAETAKPGDTIYAGVDMKMEPGWHTYWKNPGAAGMATQIKWQLPPGISAGEIQWPLPEKLPPAEVTTYGYEDEVVLLVPLKIATNFSAGEIDLKANVSWLECKEVCIPVKTDVQATLNIGSETKISADAVTIESWQKKVPQTNANYQFQAWWEKATNADTRAFVMKNLSGVADKNIKLDSVDFFPDASDQFEIQAPTEIISAYSSEIRLRKFVKKFSGEWPNEISGVIVIESGKLRFGSDVTFLVSENAPADEKMSAQASTESSTGVPPVGAGETPALPLMLLYAFIGGLILNIMPCVLPVIALKILGFVSEAKSSPRRVRALGGIYAVGVLFSFLVLAAIVIGVKSAGHQAGWGMQFGSPIFIVCLTTLVTLVALNLFGVFEVTLGGSALDAAGNLASRHGASGAFFNGVLATTLATPCTAPFLAPALGFAFSQSAATVVLIFLTVGLGLASPYVLLSWNPAWLKFLPKPGAWMEKFKIAMGFPMLATVVWLFNTAAADYGDKVFWLGVFLVVVAAAAWVFGEFFQRGRSQKKLALAVSLILFFGGYIYALENKLHWREMSAENSMAQLSSGKINWQPWSPEAVAQARAAEKIVLVDFTASWCVTCNAIVKPALENDAVSGELKKSGVVALLADYTRIPPQITAEISKYGGAGVPLVLIYPLNPDAPVIVLPQPSPLQLPSGYAKIILAALGRAADHAD